MQHLLANQILGGITWAGIAMLTQLAWCQDTHPPEEVAAFSHHPVFTQPGLSSKEYLQWMAEADEAKSASALPVRPDGPRNANVSPPSTLAHLFVKPFLSKPEWQPIALAGARSRRFSLGYESLWMRRSGDQGTTWSSGGSLGTFGEDHSQCVRLGWYTNPMERYEVALLGSLVWDRHAESPQQATALFSPSESEPDWFESFSHSSSHAQSHTARLRGYEWNKRWITDDLGNYFFGLHIIDYEEVYRLRSIDPDGIGELAFTTSNLLAGLQGGLELWHPFSQRFSVGGQGLLGLYGNFAEGGLGVNIENTSGFLRSDQKFQTAASFALDTKLRYHLNSRWHAFGSYRWWYLAGMATVDDQSIGPLASDTPLALSTDAGFLLQGATVGLEMVF
jgi:hypothetical protein